MGQSYDAFEQWKQILGVLCHCDSAVSTDQDFFSEFSGGFSFFWAHEVAVLLYQLKQVPEDFFEDSITSDNFLTHMLRSFVELLSGDSLNDNLKKRARKFRKYLVKRFGSKLSHDSVEFDPDDEYAPVVVEL